MEHPNLQDLYLSYHEVRTFLLFSEVITTGASLNISQKNSQIDTQAHHFCSNTHIHFLTGELPVEGKVHKDIFSLFFGIWKNPDTQIYEIVKYLLEHSIENSRTWSAHIRHLNKRYGLEDPLLCLRKDPPSKSQYKEIVNTKITIYFENLLGVAAAENSLMEYLHVATIGLRGRHHPALSNLITA